MHVVEQIDQKNLDTIEVKVLITDYTTLGTYSTSGIPMLLFFCLSQLELSFQKIS